MLDFVTTTSERHRTTSHFLPSNCTGLYSYEANEKLFPHFFDEF